MLVIMALAVYGRGSKPFFGLIIGLVVAGGITTTGNISGASFNPARTFGPYVANSLFGGPDLSASVSNLRYSSDSLEQCLQLLHIRT